MSAYDRDADVLSVPEGARFAGYSGRRMHERLNDEPEFAAAILVAFGESARRTISLPRLCRLIHGAEADALIPQWRERVTAWRRESEMARQAS